MASLNLNYKIESVLTLMLAINVNSPLAFLGKKELSMKVNCQKDRTESMQRLPTRIQHLFIINYLHQVEKDITPLERITTLVEYIIIVRF
jgi:hypothetical protein